MNAVDLLKAMLETISMTFISTFLAYLIGFPLGVILYSTSKDGLKPNKYINLPLGIFVNIMRSIPCLLLIVILLPVTRGVFGRGSGAWYSMIIPLFVSSFAFISRMVEASLKEVDNGAIEAAKSMGASNLFIVRRVLFREAMPSLLNGVAISSISIIGYTAFAYDFGSGGLIARAYSYYSSHTYSYLNGPYIWVVIILIVILVQFIQELGKYIEKKTDKRRRNTL